MRKLLSLILLALKCYFYDAKNFIFHSMILDYKGEILSEINQIEGGIFAEIDLESMYQFRNKCCVLDDIKNSYEVKIK